MNLSGKIVSAFRDLNAPVPSFFSPRRRARRTLVISIIVGLVVAVVFGMVLYRLNVGGRFYLK